MVDQTHARHILVRVNEIVSEADAKAKIDRLKDRLDRGAKFDELAKLNSEDATAAKGGDLGWLNPGDTVAEFDEAMKKLEPNQVSAPVRTPFGWHLIQVLERRKQDVTAERERSEAQIGDPSAQGRRGVSGLGASDPRSRLRRDSARRPMTDRTMNLGEVFAEPLLDLDAEDRAGGDSHAAERARRGQDRRHRAVSRARR